MEEEPEPVSMLVPSGARRVAGIRIDSYNIELGDEGGFVGDKASKAAFRQILARLRIALHLADGVDPLHQSRSQRISKQKLDAILTKGDARSAAVVHSAIEDFAQQLAAVIKRFCLLKSWQDTETIFVGGGFRANRIGELAIARANILLRTDGSEIEVLPICNHPDVAGLMGAAFLVPWSMLHDYNAMISVDIGGTNIRAGLLKLKQRNRGKLPKVCVCASRQWRHADEKVSRDAAVGRLGKMIRRLIKAAGKHTLRLAPVIAIGCPGLIEGNGTIVRGAQNLPGSWASVDFHLPSEIRRIVRREMSVVMHNDAVAQGLSELPHLEGVERWSILTIGTGLGNARFSRDVS